MMLLSRFIFRKYGWGVAAQITPTVLLITGIAFFGLVLFSGVARLRLWAGQYPNITGTATPCRLGDGLLARHDAAGARGVLSQDLHVMHASSKDLTGW